ncbi:MAG: DUF2062 domain-containing protein [Flavobacteriaceae bacterium]
MDCCVIVPTYNNQNTLAQVLQGIMEHTHAIIVINDGSTDGTREILNGFTGVQTVHLPKNKGKGNALRAGFKQALELGYTYAITIDSDGQHFPEDIPAFLNALAKAPDKNLLLIGARNMGHESVPKKSSFGNKFSNFWYWVETGIWLTDTQSGFRLYPIKALKDIRLRTHKFEFEIEVIVKAAWRGITVRNIPIKVLYDQPERVSHFRPIKDFARISVLNTWLVMVALFYIKPRDFFRRLKKKGIKRFFYEDFLHNSDSPRKKALSIALGIFIGLCPLWGFHTVIVITLAILFKLNKVIAFAFSNISLPPFIPFVLYLSLLTGSWATGAEISFSLEEIRGNFEIVRHLKTYIVGSLTLSTLSALVFGFLSYLFLSIFQRKKVVLNNG